MITTREKPLVIWKGMYKTAGRQYGWYPTLAMPGIGVSASVVTMHTMAKIPIYIRVITSKKSNTGIKYCIQPYLVHEIVRTYKSITHRKGTTLYILPVSLLTRIPQE